MLGLTVIGSVRNATITSFSHSTCKLYVLSDSVEFVERLANIAKAMCISAHFPCEHHADIFPLIQEMLRRKCEQIQFLSLYLFIAPEDVESILQVM